MVSCGLLLAAGTGEQGRIIARAHLLTLWFYAGLNKLLSVDFMHNPNPWLLRVFVDSPPEWLAAVFPAFVVASEAGLAIAAAWPPARTVAAFWACALHATILARVLMADWNQSVWPWNVVLGLSGFFLFRPWQESVPATLRAASGPVRFTVFVLAAYPLLFYVGLGDPYLAHHLYSRSTPTGYVCNTERQPQASRPGLGHGPPYVPGEHHCRIIDFMPSLNVPEPPEHAVFEHYFAATCGTDEVLFIDERPMYLGTRDQQRRVIHCGGGRTK
jgi:hypothetical protein